MRCSDTAVIAEALSGDGVSYGRAALEETARDPQMLARAVRSAAARVVAELEGPLAEAVTGVILSLGGAELAVIEALDFPSAEPLPQAVPATRPAVAVTSEPFQRRTGIASGTPVSLG